MGMCFYKRETPSEENILVDVVGCMSHAIYRRVREKTDKNLPWIQGAVGKYSKEFVDDVEIFLSVS